MVRRTALRGGRHPVTGVPLVEADRDAGHVGLSAAAVARAIAHGSARWQALVGRVREREALSRAT